MSHLEIFLCEVPQLDPVRDDTQSYRAWYSFEIGWDEAPPLPNIICEPPPATQQSFAALPAQLLAFPETLSKFHPRNGLTDTRSSSTSPIDGSNLSPQYLPYSNGIPTHSEPDGMDCSPLSPILLSDVDMDILTDTPSPWTQWNTIPQCVPVPSFHHNTFVAPPSDSIRKTPVQEPPPHATQYNYGFATPNAPSFDSFVFAAPEPPTYHPRPLYAMSDRIQDTVKTHWQEPPHRVATPHPSSIAALLDEFERSLTLVADELPSFEADNRSDYNRHFKLTPAHIVEDELRIPNDYLDDPHPFEREAIEPLGESQDQCLPNLHDPPSLPFERKSTTQPPGDPPPTFFLDLADRPRLPFDPAPFPTYTVPGPSSARAPRASHPLARPRPPTPPPSRRPSKPAPRHNTRTTHPSPHRLASTSKIDRAEPPVAQASVQAGKSTQPLSRLGAARVPRPPPCPAQVLGDDELGGVGGGSGRGVPPGRRTALGATLRPPAPVRCSQQRREEAEEGKGKAHRVRTKRTRFVVPGAEDEGDEDARASPDARPRWTSADSTRRTSGPGPLRSILRNKHATPYDKAMVRHGVRRASVP